MTMVKKKRRKMMITMVIFYGDDEDDDDGHAEPDDRPRYEATTQPMQASNCSPELVICQCGLGWLAPALGPRAQTVRYYCA